MADPSTGETRPTAAVYHPDSLLEVTQVILTVATLEDTSDSLTAKKLPCCSLCYWKHYKAKLPKMCKRKLVDTVILYNCPCSHRRTYRVPDLNSSSFCLCYVLQSEAASSEVQMKAQILILEEQREEVSTFQK